MKAYRLMQRMGCALSVVTIWCLTAPGIAWAGSDAAPQQIVQRSSEQMIQGLKKYQGQWEAHQGALETLIERVMLPHMAVDRMARAVVGREHWQSASFMQRRRFTQAFQTMVIRTYSAAFATYDGEVVKIYPMRGEPDEQRQIVKTAVLRPNGQDIKVNYYFAKLKNRWLVDDFDVEGVRLVQNYRAQYADTLHKGGLDHLTEMVQKRNAEVKNGR